MPGVLDGYIPEETAIRPQNVIHLGPNLPPLPDHYPRPPVPTPCAPVREEVRRYIFQDLRRQYYSDVLSPLVALRI